MSMNRWICWLTGLWRSARLGVNVSGCDYIEEQVREGCHVEIDRCEVCGRYSISWRGGERVHSLDGSKP